MPDLRFGSFLAPDMLEVYGLIASKVGDALGMSTELVVETDYENCRNDINDICFVCSLPYVVFERAGNSPAVPVAAPVLVGERYLDKPIYFSDVIVHADSGARSFADLRGRSWAYNEPLSHSGYGITRYHLVQMEETSGFFGDVIEAGFHEKAIAMVAAGTVDASAIDSQVLAIQMRDQPEYQESLRIIDSLGPSTIQPVAVSRRFPDAFKQDVASILCDLHNDPECAELFRHGLVDRFVRAGPSDYDDIRSMLEACERADFMELR
jgi:phosphonate transport system substrate-binding protein